MFSPAVLFRKWRVASKVCKNAGLKPGPYKPTGRSLPAELGSWGREPGEPGTDGMFPLWFRASGEWRLCDSGGGAMMSHSDGDDDRANRD
jgi:hypothetical protein